MLRNKFIYFCFFLSGAAGLMYEIIWTRFFSLTFGATTYSITTVLTAFMAGLALGSILFGTVADRIKQRLMLYGWIELLIGLYALLFPLLYNLSSRSYLFLIGLHDLSVTQKLFLKFVFGFLIMLLPTTLMGGSLPVLSRFFIKDLKGVSSKLGTLYALNTFGAVVGTYLVGFYLLERAGLHASILIAAAINFGIGIAMILISMNFKEMEGVFGKEAAPLARTPLTKHERLVICFAISAFMISGFVSLSYEVVWTRILSLIIGSSTYAFTMILIGFLIGIALGSYLISNPRLIPPDRIHLMTFSLIEIGIGISAFILIPLFSKLPYIMIKAFQIKPDSYNFITFYQFILSLFVIILPTTLMGATLPVIGKIVSREIRAVGASVGNIYFFNTFGAIFGSFFAGFLFIPYLGTLNTLKLGIGINILLGMGGILLAREQLPQKRVILVTFLCTGALLSGVWLYKWDTTLMDSGVSIYGHRMAKNIEQNKNFKNGSKMLYLHEGINATVSVRKAENVIFLRTNGKSDASTGDPDMPTQIFLGYLPMMLHPDPRHVLVIGLASGITAGTVAQFDGVQSLDIVEIEPSMVQAASFFQEFNHNVMENPKTRLFLNDGRNHLLETNKKYDLIVSEPSNPWISGIASLFTTDYFKLVNDKLNPGGIFCLWVPSYSTSLENLRMIFRTAALSFEDLQLWVTSIGDILFIGSNKKLNIDPVRIGQVMNYDHRTKEDFSRYLFVKKPMEIPGRLLLDKRGILNLSDGAQINSDNYPYLEFQAPRDIYLDDMFHIYQTLTQWNERNTPEPIQKIMDEKDLALVYFHRSKVYTDMGFFNQAKDYINKALELDNNNSDFYFQLGETLFLEKSDPEVAKSIIKKGLELNKTADGLLILVNILQSTGKDEEALTMVEENKDLIEDYEKLRGNILYKLARCEQAVPYLKDALNKKQDQEYSLFEKLGNCYIKMGQLETAEGYLIQSVKKEEMNPRSQFSLAELYYSQEKYEEAGKIFLFLAEHWNYRRNIYLQRLAECNANLYQQKKHPHSEKETPQNGFTN